MSRPESLVADCSMHALQPPERRGRQRESDDLSLRVAITDLSLSILYTLTVDRFIL